MNDLGLYPKFAQGRELEHHLTLAIRDQGESAKEPPLSDPPALSERANFQASLECVAPLLWKDERDRTVRETTSTPIWKVGSDTWLELVVVAKSIPAVSEISI